MKLFLKTILFILMVLSCNKPHQMENGAQGGADASPQLSDDESVSPPSNITGAYLACQSDNQPGREVLDFELRCGLEKEDGSKLVADRKNLKWEIEHKENNVKVITIDSKEPSKYDVLYKFSATETGQILKTVTNGNILISADKLKDIRTDIIIGERRSIAELEKEYSISTDVNVDSNSEACQGGVKIEGGCWYYGNRGQSCSEVCEDKGGYNDRTESYANNKGENTAQCVSVLNSLSFYELDKGINTRDYSSLRLGGYVTQKQPWVYNQPDRKTGCATYYGDLPGKWVDSSPAVAGSSYPDLKRACSCNQ